MRAWLSSPRRRRRLLWIAALVLAAGGIALVAVATQQSSGKGARSNAPAAPAFNAASQRSVPLAAADRRRITATLKRFVATAVARRTGASYDLVTADFRGGTTRAEWARGDTPVYRYPAQLSSAGEPQIVGSYPNDVLANLLLQPRPGASAGPILFSVELKRQRSRWLVDSFAPLEVYSKPGAPPTKVAVKHSHKPAKTAAPTNSGFDRGRLSTTWFLLPVGIFFLIVLVPVGIWTRSWLAGHRAERAYGGRKELPPLPPRRG